MSGARWVPLIAGVLLLAYGGFALHSGRVISTWGQWNYRPGFLYWVTTLVFVGAGIANLVVAVRMWLR